MYCLPLKAVTVLAWLAVVLAGNSFAELGVGSSGGVNGKSIVACRKDSSGRGENSLSSSSSSILIVAKASGSKKATGSKNDNNNSKKNSKVAAKTAIDNSEAKKTFLTGLLSGAFAGTTVDLILFPLDTVKTRLQAKAGATFTMDMFNGIFDGVAPAIAASAPCAAVFFGAYDTLKRVLADKASEKFQPFVHSAAAAGADLTQSVVRVPFEVVKQRLQAGVDTSTLQAVSNIYKARGLGGFYTGWGALALRDLPFDIIEFPIYEGLKKEWARRKGSNLAPWQGSLCGSLAGGIAAGITTPLDVIKTRLMTQSAGQYKGMLDCFQTIVKEEGMAALYSGAVPRMSSIAFGGAIFFGAYEVAKDIIEKRDVFGEMTQPKVANTKSKQKRSS